MVSEPPDEPRPVPPISTRRSALTPIDWQTRSLPQPLPNRCPRQGTDPGHGITRRIRAAMAEVPRRRPHLVDATA